MARLFSGAGVTSMSTGAPSPDASSVEVRIVTASLDTAHEERDKHVKGADFLNVEAFPEITFKSTKIERTGETTGKLTGDTMSGVVTMGSTDAEWSAKRATQ